MNKKQRNYIAPQTILSADIKHHQLVCTSILVGKEKHPQIDPDPDKRGDYGGTLAKETELGANTETENLTFKNLWED